MSLVQTRADIDRTVSTLPVTRVNVSGSRVPTVTFSPHRKVKISGVLLFCGVFLAMAIVANGASTAQQNEAKTPSNSENTTKSVVSEPSNSFTQDRSNVTRKGGALNTSITSSTVQKDGGQPETTVTVNGSSVPVPQNGSVQHVETTANGNTTVNISNTSTGSGDSSSTSSTSTSVNVSSSDSSFTGNTSQTFSSEGSAY